MNIERMEKFVEKYLEEKTKKMPEPQTEHIYRNVSKKLEKAIDLHTKL